jgi:hypothetical protein
VIKRSQSTFQKGNKLFTIGSKNDSTIDEYSSIDEQYGNSKFEDSWNNENRSLIHKMDENVKFSTLTNLNINPIIEEKDEEQTNEVLS